jgi:hypothetical protein
LEFCNVKQEKTAFIPKTGGNILDYRKQGLKVIYALKTPCILEFFSCVTAVLKQQAKDNERLLAAL